MPPSLSAPTAACRYCPPSAAKLRHRCRQRQGWHKRGRVRGEAGTGTTRPARMRAWPGVLSLPSCHQPDLAVTARHPPDLPATARHLLELAATARHPLDLAATTRCPPDLATAAAFGPNLATAARRAMVWCRCGE
ncbi:hypothetical protein GUJ93_ZPchr0010g9203 [Zizania palustris]|uniref:Uncharacterized protein n=1 Tax=Zizania palustris TaxID=103762 RepID=A0A8J6BLN7_ZIZPA|nr:hypothetical protein GUJ93_ZPchr0010g9203 [Zizania palustris]